MTKNLSLGSDPVRSECPLPTVLRYLSEGDHMEADILHELRSQRPFSLRRQCQGELLLLLLEGSRTLDYERLMLSRLRRLFHMWKLLLLEGSRTLQLERSVI